MIRNPGFELADALAGSARDWVTTSLGTGEESVDFDGNSPSQISAYESFEAGWALSGAQQFIASFDADDVEHGLVETMAGWEINQTVMLLGAVEAASYNAQSTTYETFQAWDEGAPDIGLELADEELESAALETFEWDTVGAGMMGSVGGATFNHSSDTRETFIVREPQIVQVQGNRFRTTSGAPYIGSQDDIVTFTSTGALPEEVTEGFEYYVFLVESHYVTVSRTPRNSNGAALVINDSGTGVHRIHGDPNRFWIDAMP